MEKTKKKKKKKLPGQTLKYNEQWKLITLVTFLSMLMLIIILLIVEGDGLLKHVHYFHGLLISSLKKFIAAPKLSYI